MSKQNKQKGIDMIIGKEVTFELCQFWAKDYSEYLNEKLQCGIKFDSIQNFFKTLGENHQKKSANDALLPYELRRVVKLYNMEHWRIDKDYAIKKYGYGDESKVPLHYTENGYILDNFFVMNSVVTDRFVFSVRDSLEYAKDIPPFMAKNYPNTPFYYLGEDYADLNQDKALIFKVGFYGNDERPAVGYTYLTDCWDKPVVINSSGYQLWPQIAKKKRPDIFKQLLSKKTEDIKIK